MSSPTPARPQTGRGHSLPLPPNCASSLSPRTPPPSLQALRIAPHRPCSLPQEPVPRPCTQAHTRHFPAAQDRLPKPKPQRPAPHAPATLLPPRRSQPVSGGTCSEPSPPHSRCSLSGFSGPTGPLYLGRSVLPRHQSSSSWLRFAVLGQELGASGSLTPRYTPPRDARLRAQPTPDTLGRRSLGWTSLRLAASAVPLQAVVRLLFKVQPRTPQSGGGA